MRLKTSEKVVLPLNHEYSVNSGVFAGIDDAVYMKLNECGQYKYCIDKKPSDELLKKFNKVDIMSDYSDNEDVVGKRLFGCLRGIKFDEMLGYYSGLYAGYVNESDYRKIATSGGFATWILCELLRTGKIDGVIHPHAVDPKKNNGILFKYQISRSEKEIKSGAKARYYPMELSGVLKQVKCTPGRYAVVGISEFITELRLLCEQEKIFKERLVFMIGLINAHQKTTKYAEVLAWQQGISPGELSGIDFRVKRINGMAWDYMCRFDWVRNGKKLSMTKQLESSAVQHWNMGFFKSKFSDFTDNFFNELADVSLGDAWLEGYARDPRGTNLVIVRNPIIAKIINRAAKDGRITIDNITKDRIIESQGMVSHSIEELPYRLYKAGKRGCFVPKKRCQPSRNLSFWRRAIQDLRWYVLKNNCRIYNRSVTDNNLVQYEEFANKCYAISTYLYKMVKWSEKSTKEKIITLFKLRQIKSYLIKSRALVWRLCKRVKNIIYSTVQKINSRVVNRLADGAIVTLGDDFNYGNVMQRYALQKFLSNNGLNFIHISIHTKYLKSIRDRYLVNGLTSFVKQNIKSRSFNAITAKGYGCYIIGSDQVWRNHGTDDIWNDYMIFWLSFLRDNDDSSRISYAASFGVDDLSAAGIDEGLRLKVEPYLKKFDAISVREKSGVTMINNIAGCDMNARVDLDPALLLSAEDYSSLIDKLTPTKNKNVGVFCYILDLHDDKTKIIDKIAKAYHGKYNLVTAEPSTKLMSVEKWLAGFRDAEFVVTDSFHGAVFAIINNRDFVVFANKNRGLARMKNLLESLDISSDRLILDDGMTKFNHDSLKPINWAKINKKIRKMRKESGDWLLNVVRSAK